MERMVNRMKFIVSPNDSSDPIVCTNLIQLSQYTGVSPSYLRTMLRSNRKNSRSKFKINRVNIEILK